MRLIPRIDQDPRLVAFVQTPAGKAACLVAFAALLAPNRPYLYFEVVAMLVLMTLLPSRRRLLLSLGFLYLTTIRRIFGPHVAIAVARQEGLGSSNVSLVFRIVLLATLALMLFGLWLAYRNGHTLAWRRPLLTLYLCYSAVFLGVALLPFSGLVRVVAWSFVAVVGAHLWYLSYALLDRTSPNRDPVHLQAGTFNPFWTSAIQTGSPTPYGKGAAYLRKVECKTPEELAVCQLKGLKLLLWTWVLFAALRLADLFLYGRPGNRLGAAVVRLWGLVSPGPLPHTGIPTMGEAFAQSALGHPFPWYTCWAGLIAEFLTNVLSVTVGGGMLIAICRMAGFRALRNTYRPLEAQTVADFWNRYAFYYKEMLVEFFFYPTFIRYFKRHPRLRVVAATFAAAGLGNLMAEFFHYPHYVVQLGLGKALLNFQVFAFQTLVLATGIAVSQLRGKARAKGRAVSFGRRVIAATGVGIFYCLLSVFDNPGRVYDLEDHFRFLFHLFGIV